jgi:hypothetical protein
MATRHPTPPLSQDALSVSEILTRGLDHLQVFIDHNANTLSKADWLASQQRILDHLLENAKRSIGRLGGPDAPETAPGLLRTWLTDTLNDASDTVGVLHTEAHRNHLGETLTELTQASLNLLKNEIDLGFEAFHTLSHLAAGSPTLQQWGWPSQRRPGMVTRVEIESDTGIVHPHAGVPAGH